MALSKAEREHILRWSEDDADVATFYTHNERWAKRLATRGATLKATHHLKGKAVAWTLLLPATWTFLPRPKRAGASKGNPDALVKARAARGSLSKSQRNER